MQRTFPKLRPFNALPFVFLFFSCYLFLPSANAQIFVLSGSNWSDPTDWQGGVVPPNPFNGTSITVTANVANADIDNLEIGSSATLIINSGNRLNINIGGGGTFTNNGVIEINGTLRIIDNTQTLANTGKITISSSGRLDNRGHCTNSGTSTINNEGVVDASIASDDTFTSSGSFTNDGGASIGVVGMFTSDGTFDNIGSATVTIFSTGSFISNNTFSNLGSAFLDNRGTFTNNSTLDNKASAEVKNTSSFTNSATGTINNESTFNAGNAGMDVFDNLGTFINNGTGTVTSNGTFTNSGDLTNTTLASFTNNNDFENTATGTIKNTGTFNAATGNMDTFDNDGPFTNTVPGDMTNNGIFISTALYTNGIGATTTNTRIFTILSGGSVSNKGNFINGDSGNDVLTNEGTFYSDNLLTSNGNFNNENILTNDGTFDNTDDLTNNGEFTNEGVFTTTKDFLNTGLFNNNGTLINSDQINNDKTFNNNALGTIDSNGSFNNASGSVLTNNNVFDAGDIQAHTLTNSGTIINNKTLTSDGQVTNNATLTNSATGAVTISEDLNNSNSGTITNENIFSVGVGGADTDRTNNDGTFINNGSLSNSGRFFNTGTLQNNSTGTIETSNDQMLNRGALINNGMVTRTSGILRQDDANGVISGSGSFDLNGGTLEVTNGTVSPGNSIGIIAITGDYTVSGPATHFIEVDGNGNNDQITVTGTASLNGTIIVQTGDGEFTDGENWTVLKAGTLVGSFSTVTPILPPSVMGGSMTATYPGNTALITYNGPTFLPIELISFSGKITGPHIQLDWSTSQELNNDYMAIERSGEDLIFQEIGRIKGKGTTQERQSYQFIDENPLEGLNYYRLRQVDLDGTENLSNVIVLNMEVEIEGLQLQAFPNPSQDHIRISWLSSLTTDDGSITLFEMATGKEIRRFALPKGTNVMDLTVDDLPSGIYVIQVVQGGQRKAIQFVKD